MSAEAVNAQDLVASLEADLYEENVSSILRAAVARMVQGMYLCVCSFLFILDAELERNQFFTQNGVGK